MPQATAVNEMINNLFSKWKMVQIKLLNIITQQVGV